MVNGHATGSFGLLWLIPALPFAGSMLIFALRDRIRDSGLFDKLVVTDSHPRAVQLQSDFVEVISIAPVLSAALQP